MVRTAFLILVFIITMLVSFAIVGFGLAQFLYYHGAPEYIAGSLGGFVSVVVIPTTVTVLTNLLIDKIIEWRN